MRASQKGLILAIIGLGLGIWVGLTFQKKHIEIKDFRKQKTTILPCPIFSKNISISFDKDGIFEAKITTK
jgi:hypothetical protein